MKPVFEEEKVLAAFSSFPTVVLVNFQVFIHPSLKHRHTFQPTISKTAVKLLMEEV
jgi:hypothetical protein